MPVKDSLKAFYKKNYKKFLIVPAILILASFLVIASTYLSTGTIVDSDIELKGGITSTLDWSDEAVPELEQLEALLAQALESDIVVRTIHEYGSSRPIAIMFEAEVHVESQQMREAVEQSLAAQGFTPNITAGSYSTHTVGPSMGKAFLDTAKIALAVGFLLMSMIIFFTFRNKLAAGLILLSAILDVTGAVAVMNILSIKLSPATIAALLMILGYSVDSNILITTSILRKRAGEAIDRAMKAVKTGMTMVASTIAALAVLGFVSNSPMLSNMAAVLLAGLIFDISNTWFMNMNLLLLSEEKKHGKAVA